MLLAVATDEELDHLWHSTGARIAFNRDTYRPFYGRARDMLSQAVKNQ